MFLKFVPEYYCKQYDDAVMFCRYNGSDGMMAVATQDLVGIPPSTSPPVYLEKIEDTPAPFYCSGGCGGNITTEFDITKYQFGNCTGMETCS